MDAAYRFAEFAAKTKYDDLPESVVEMVKLDILDTLGCWLAGSDSDLDRAVLQLMKEMGGTPEASVLGTKDKLPAARAGFVNAVRVVNVDFDDHHDPAHCHIGASAVPAALAMAEKVGGVTGRQLITAVAVGAEIASRLGRYTVPRNPAVVMGGWDYTETLGIFSAAVIAAKLLGLTEEGIHNALGIAYHQAAGTSVSAMDGADTKDLGSGFACAYGIQSALLAEKGLTGAKNIFDECPGSFALQYNAGCDREALVSELGKRYELLYLGFKEYPCCTNTHRHIDAVRDLMAEQRIAPEEIREIRLHLSPMIYPMSQPEEITKRPPDALSGKFSIPWTVACMAARGRVGIAEFLDEARSDPAILDMAQRIVSVCDERLPDFSTPAEVHIVTVRGTFSTRTKAELYGHWTNPMKPEALKQKFRACVESGGSGLGSIQQESLIDAVMSLEQMKNAVDLITMAGGKSNV